MRNLLQILSINQEKAKILFRQTIKDLINFKKLGQFIFKTYSHFCAKSSFEVGIAKEIGQLLVQQYVGSKALQFGLSNNTMILSGNLRTMKGDLFTNQILAIFRAQKEYGLTYKHKQKKIHKIHGKLKKQKEIQETEIPIYR